MEIEVFSRPTHQIDFCANLIIQNIGDFFFTPLVSTRTKNPKYNMSLHGPCLSGVVTFAKEGASSGLLVMGEDSGPGGFGFKSQHHILDGHFLHLFVVKIVMFVWKDKNKWKRGRGGPIFNTFAKEANNLGDAKVGCMGFKWAVLLFYTLFLGGPTTATFCLVSFFSITILHKNCRLWRHLFPNLKMGQPGPLFHLFSSFQTNITIFTTNKCEKVHLVYSAGIQSHDLCNMSLLP